MFQGLSTAARRGPADSIVRALLMVALRFRDVWETMACQRLCDSLTFHVFTTPPTKVYAGFIMVFSKLFILFCCRLDIGCGGFLLSLSLDSIRMVD